MSTQPSQNKGASDFLKIPVVLAASLLSLPFSFSASSLSLRIVTILPSLTLTPSVVPSAIHSTSLPLLAACLSCQVRASIGHWKFCFKTLKIKNLIEFNHKLFLKLPFSSSRLCNFYICRSPFFNHTPAK